MRSGRQNASLEDLHWADLPWILAGFGALVRRPGVQLVPENASVQLAEFLYQAWRSFRLLVEH